MTECLCLAVVGGLAGLAVARLIGATLARVLLPLQLLGNLSFEIALDGGRDVRPRALARFCA